jgi:metallo-beta-lactamase class B
MFKAIVKTTAVLAISLLFNSKAVAQVKEPKTSHPEWSKPYPAFRIVGNLYYVGTYDLACYLLVTAKGNILINTGLADSEPLIRKSIESLHFKFNDTKILLTTQAHFDHLGAMAAIKKATGAKMMIDEQDAEVAADGGSSDYVMGGYGSTFTPIKPDSLLHDNDVIKLGDMQVTILHHPGHTKGSCSFLFDVNDGHRSYKVLIANMPTIIIDGKFSEVKGYPNIATDYAYTLSAMKRLHFDIWLASHAGQFALAAKHKPGAAYNPTPFIDRADYDKQLADLQKAFDDKIKQE